MKKPPTCVNFYSNVAVTTNFYICHTQGITTRKKCIGSNNIFSLYYSLGNAIMYIISTVARLRFVYATWILLNTK